VGIVNSPRYVIISYIAHVTGLGGVAVNSVIDAYIHDRVMLKHDPEKHALGRRPDGWAPVFPRDKREAFAREIMLNQ